MNKKFLSAVLFGVLMASSTGTFVSCKDYDDDIKDLQEELNKKASLEEMTQKLSTMETAVADAKKIAEEAKAKAEEALKKAEEGGSGSGEVTSTDLENLKKELQAQISKLASLAYIIHSGFISGYQNRYGDNLKPPTNVYHRMTA